MAVIAAALHGALPVYSSLHASGCHVFPFLFREQITTGDKIDFKQEKHFICPVIYFYVFYIKVLTINDYYFILSALTNYCYHQYRRLSNLKYLAFPKYSKTNMFSIPLFY